MFVWIQKNGVKEENRRESRGFLTDSFKCEKPRDVEECEDESLRKFSQESGENVSLLHL